jgi:hypothetical protein
VRLAAAAHPDSSHGDSLGARPTFEVVTVLNIWPSHWTARCSLILRQKGMPPTARFAESQAKQLAANIVARLNSASTLPFEYRSRGQLSSIGHNQGRCRSWRREALGFHGVADVARSVPAALRRTVPSGSDSPLDDSIPQ